MSVLLDHARRDIYDSGYFGYNGLGEGTLLLSSSIRFDAINPNLAELHLAHTLSNRFGMFHGTHMLLFWPVPPG